MKRPLLKLKRLTIPMVLALTFVAVGCGKKVQPPPPPPPVVPTPPPPAPTISLRADRNAITTGQSVTLTWSSTNAATVTLQPGIGGVQPAAGGTRQVSPTANTTYTATATGPGGTATSSAVAITVTPPPPPPTPAPTITLRADRTAITAGQSVTLTWAGTNATTVTIQPGIGAVQPPASGTRQASPTANTTYTATATGPGGTVTSSNVAITVTAPLPPPPPPPTIDQLFTQNMVPILFDYDKSDIRADQQSKLTAIVAWLRQNGTVRLTIEGHADERGSQEYNIALGDDRAESVMKFLADQGIAASRMTTISFGEERPVCRDADEGCWQRNRRAAFIRIP